MSHDVVGVVFDRQMEKYHDHYSSKTNQFSIVEMNRHEAHRVVPSTLAFLLMEALQTERRRKRKRHL